MAFAQRARTSTYAFHIHVRIIVGMDDTLRAQVPLRRRNASTAVDLDRSIGWDTCVCVQCAHHHQSICLSGTFRGDGIARVLYLGYHRTYTKHSNNQQRKPCASRQHEYDGRCSKIPCQRPCVPVLWAAHMEPLCDHATATDYLN